METAPVRLSANGVWEEGEVTAYDGPANTVAAVGVVVNETQSGALRCAVP